MRVAIVGSGISGLAVAHTLAGRADITLYEAGSWWGGHTHTVDVTLPVAGVPVTHGVDTGFLVYNERTYPQLIALFKTLGIATAPSDMSFSVKVPGAFGPGALEWSGTSLSSVFAQRANLLRPRFWRMLRDLMRFNAMATRIAEAGHDEQMAQPLGEFLDANGFSAEFRDWYFLPMIGCIWSCPTDQMLRFPVSTMIRFCHNHGLLQVADRPQWWTVAGGARNYVDAIVGRIADKRLNTPVRRVLRDEGGVEIVTGQGSERFDKVVLATHSDQALALLHEPDAHEREVLGAIRYQPNRAVLHTDSSVLPANPAAWAAWNYERPAGAADTQVCLHYLLNRLQPLPWRQPVLVSLNPLAEIPRNQIMGEFDYAHPVFDLAAVQAQAQVSQLQGRRHTYFCGAWMGYGFHEDGLKAGQGVARQLLVKALQPAEATA
ncbi:MAG: FAD-dependent oxidoreductase [Burkholderiales bacterium]|nr:FAD-dependent oxidoreductase [Burkholderiales bacterium]